MLKMGDSRHAEGYTALKYSIIPPIKPIENPENTRKHVERFAKVREHIGNSIDLAIDFHGRVSPAMAVRFCEEHKPYMPFFIEDSCLPANIDCMVNIARSTTIPIAAGGRFIISPDTNVSVIQKTRELGLVSMTGALNPTEIQTAHLAGADFVKLFPVTSLGADYVKAVKAPLSHVKFLAVGGVNTENMSDYLKAGVCGFGLGSNIVDKKLIA